MTSKSSHSTDQIYDKVMAEAAEYYERREEEFGAELIREIERQVMLRIIDQHWREHLYEMDYLQEGINLRAMGQKDPLVEWQREGYEMFGQLMHGIATDFVRYVMHVQVVQPPEEVPAVSNVSYSAPDESDAGGGIRSGPPRRRGRCADAGGGTACHAADREERVGQDPPQRAVPVREREEVQALPRTFVVRDFSDDLKDLRRRVEEANGYLRIDDTRARFAELEAQVQEPDLWDDQDRAKQVNSAYARARDDIDAHDRLAKEMEDAEVLHELAREMDDETQEPDLIAAIASLDGKLRQLELRSLFSGEHDEADAICRVNAKDGGVDAQDWTEMLLRMYGRWAERRGFDFEVDDVSEGTEAGILSAEFTITGRYAYGLMAGERGVHRLVRISPFDSQSRRQTSFAAVEVYPALDDVDIDIDESDITMEVFRASGAGGQHVNKTSSAVRLIHVPTGLVASSPGGAQSAPESQQGAGPAEGHAGHSRRSRTRGRAGADRRW